MTIVLETDHAIRSIAVFGRFNEEVLPTDSVKRFSLLTTHWAFILAPQAEFYIIKSGQSIAGFALVAPDKHPSGEKMAAVIEWVYIYKKFRNMSLGAQLVGHIVKKYKNLRVGIEDKNLKRFYTNLGFKHWSKPINNCFSGGTTKSALSLRAIDITNSALVANTASAVHFATMAEKLSINDSVRHKFIQATGGEL